MECVILLRNPEHGQVIPITDGEDGIHVFDNHEDAVELAEHHPLCQAWPHQIVELDEL